MSPGSRSRVLADGRHLRVGDEVFHVRGVTYGGFAARRDGAAFPEHAVLKRDLVAIAEAGLTTVRTYDPVPEDLLDLAGELSLRVLVGLHHHDWRMEPRAGRAARIRVRDAGRRAVDAALESYAGDPRILALAVGNEYPCDVVRLHGIGTVADGLADLVARCHAGDPGLLVTYGNFPTTEFLDAEGQDLVCYHVFLDEAARLRAYLRHLRVVAGDRPLVIGELGVPALVHGDTVQATSLAAQLPVVDETGCAGATVFSWTDDWAVAGTPVRGWGFGLTDTERRPRPGLAVVSRWAATGLGDLRGAWPRVSVLVCAYNAERTLDECLTSLLRCGYPDFEVLVCDDGSTDRTAQIAARYPFRLLRLAHAGLSCARNAGLDAATGEIVAYLDSDAACHPDWLHHLVLSFDDARVAATGGPNLPCPGAGIVERAVALSPGGPTEVLVSDDRAEHVPGCNMAYRRDALRAVGGFRPDYTAAGDDVDVCWKLLDEGRQIAFAAAAQVYHHRRDTVGGYLRQQRGYGRAERMLSGAHPHRFNRLGQARWSGFVYGGARIATRLLRPVVYHGPAGTAPYQPVARRRAETAVQYGGVLLPLTLAPALAGLLLAPVTSWALPAGAAAVAAVLGYALVVATTLVVPPAEPRPVALRLLVAALHVLQPFARLWGRLRGRPLSAAPAREPAWSGDRPAWLRHLQDDLTARRCVVHRGGPCSAWDVCAAVGPFLTARIVTAVLWRWQPAYRVRWLPRPALPVLLAALAGLTAVDPALAAAGTGAAAVAIGSEALVLRRRVHAALTHTTRRAGSSRETT
ncbi:glycosyltransferase [Couchioplanes azureus]|uniref:glycosyltransferase n=1 Tax=Couchioplanes caeruleus TaxID=56438 RepID=UPI001670E389|nr:glycosyltransferase family A protein [Couchioplanes caeruleus]